MFVIAMKRNCYLDLRFRSSSASSPHDSMNELLNMNKNVVGIPHGGSGRHMLDVIELQARVIIWLASQKRDGSTEAASATSLSLQSQALLMHAPQGFSIKTSLRNFLHKRKKRSQKSHPH
ncbi:unnamed protein product [Sphenostylis stenocarpa]|uniref:Uncharacterized protein n=1 Tax=Sphenostylis stenocarpa TaxID=92480 RepID=A0AA86VT30_9FABA|nr:unnamed protein product [Sphenostylis stenocarpa]